MDDDVNNSFLIVARAIESMAIMPNESQKALIDKIAIMIATEQTLTHHESKYPGVWFVKSKRAYQATFQFKKKIYKVSGLTDKICYQRLQSLKSKVKNNEQK